MATPKLLIIPGIGDDMPKAYRTFARNWQSLGYDVDVVNFGWSETQAAYAPAFARLLDIIDGYGDRELYIMGVSAGGTTAINALAARPGLVRKVITVCSPLDRMPGLRNPLLAASIEQTRRILQTLPADQKQRILSAYAWYDNVVAAPLSRAPGVHHLRIWCIIHAPSIYVGVLFYRRRLRRFLIR